MTQVSLRRINLVFGFALLSGLLFGATAAATPQDTVDDDAPLILEEQNVYSGPNKWLRGMEAYNSGDYELAETYFRSVRNYYYDIVLATAFSGGGTGFPDLAFQISGTGVQETGIGLRNRPRQGLSDIGLSFSKSNYALGATMVKLDRLVEARQFFGKALFYDKKNHDARVRISLIDLLRDKPETAERQIELLTNWCRSTSCTGDSEVGIALTMIRDAYNAYTSESS